MGEKRYRHLLFLLISFVFVALFSRATSFLYAFEGGDPALFKQMGLALLQGKTLYTELFDNKGCLLYLIQAVGLALGGNFAILLLQTLSLTFTLVIWDKTLALRHAPRQRNLILGLLGVLLLAFYYNGDLSEEWCLPLVSLPIYLFLRDRLKPWQWLVSGICFGLIAFIRVNNACAMIGFVVYALAVMLRERQWNDFIKAIGCFLSGAVLIAVLCIGWFYFKAGWSGVDEMLYATFTSNFEYIGLRFYPTWHALMAYGLILVLSIVLTIINAREEKDLLIPALIGYACFAFGFGTCCFVHYLMALLPLVVVLFLSFKPEKARTNRKIAWVTAVPILYYLAYPIGLLGSEVILGNDPYKHVYAQFHEVVKEMPEVERSQIYVYNLSGLGSGMMQHEGLLRCNRIFYWPQHQLPRLLKEQAERPAITPQWIMMSWDRPYELNDSLFISQGYEMQYHFTADLRYLKRPIQLGNQEEICLYRIKQ